MINSVGDYPIHRMLATEDRVTYFVPPYQREYSWGINEWDRFFNDILENSENYFIGSVICINQTQDAMEDHRLELIDGQQRMTTISLLFAAIYSKIKEHEGYLSEDRKTELVNLKYRLILKNSKEIRLCLQTQNNNNSDYEAVLSEVGIIDQRLRPPNAGNRRIFKAFEHFKKRIDEMVKNENKDNLVEKVIEFLKKIISALFIKIEVDSHANAYILFEALNNRGMPLTAIDLIKNKLLASVKPETEVKRFFDKWKLLLDYLGDDHTVQERFFRQYYNAFKNELGLEDPEPLATRPNLIQIYERLIKDDYEKHFEKIIDAGKVYSQIILLDKDEQFDERIKSRLRDLGHIEGAPSYLLLLYLFTHKDKLQLENEDLSNVIKLLVSFFVRRNLTDVPPTRDLIRLFMSIVEKIIVLQGKNIINTIKQELVSTLASPQVFEDKLKGLIYEENRTVTRFVLCTLAENMAPPEILRDLWEKKGNNYLWSIEHIFPQGKNIPDFWVDMIADGNKAKAEGVKETHVHKLGNLTITMFNSALGNKSFKEKRDRLDKKKERPIGYKNGLTINKDLAEARGWSTEQIDARTEKLAEQVIELFKL